MCQPEQCWKVGQENALEVLQNFRTVRAFGREHKEKQAFDKCKAQELQSQFSDYVDKITDLGCWFPRSSGRQMLAVFSPTLVLVLWGLKKNGRRLESVVNWALFESEVYLRVLLSSGLHVWRNAGKFELYSSYWSQGCGPESIQSSVATLSAETPTDK